MEGMRMRDFIVKVMQVTATESLDSDDREYLDEITGEHTFFAMGPEHALDLFHMTTPIACLEDFSIECEGIADE
jgi:hypothetical protein